MLKAFWSGSISGISGAGFLSAPSVRLGALTAASTQCLTIHLTSSVRPPGGDLSIYSHFQKKPPKTSKERERKKEKPMLWFQINQFVTGQIPLLQAVTPFLFFFVNAPCACTTKLFLEIWLPCPRGTAAPGKQGLAQALRRLRGHHAGSADQLCGARSRAGPFGMPLSYQNTRPALHPCCAGSLPVLHRVWGKADCLSKQGPLTRRIYPLVWLIEDSPVFHPSKGVLPYQRLQAWEKQVKRKKSQQ